MRFIDLKLEVVAIAQRILSKELKDFEMSYLSRDGCVRNRIGERGILSDPGVSVANKHLDFVLDDRPQNPGKFA